MGLEQHLYDSAGNWLAFRRDRFLFTPTGSWLGWVGGRHEVFDTEGLYLGTIVSDRLFRSLFPGERVNLNHPGYPGREEAADHPGYPGRSEVPIGMEDVGLLEHA